MIKNFTFTLLFFVATVVTSTKNTNAADFVFLRDTNVAYFSQILKAALEAADGDHTVRESTLLLPQSRAFLLLGNMTPQFNILLSGHSIERETDFLQINIPLTRGLLGYRIFVILPESAAAFQGISTLEQLTTNITVGSGIGWPDTPILRRAGFHVSTAPVDLLWRMLDRKRFIAFPRGMNELHENLVRQQADLNTREVQAETTIMLHYQFDHFFYINKKHHEHAEIVKQGLLRLYANGKFMEIFQNAPFIKQALAEANQNKRKIFKLVNQTLSDQVANIPDKFWHSFEKNNRVE